MKHNYSSARRQYGWWIMFCWLLAAGMLMSQGAQAQTYSMPVSGTSSITACEGTLYDDGGPNNSPSANSNGVLTINPGVAGNKIKLDFTTIQLYYEQISIYDGTSTGAPLIAEFTSGSGTGTVYATNNTGALTVKFTSNYYNYYGYQGFAATISCVTSVPLADLAIQGASAQPLSIVAGNNMYVTSSIYNLGGTTASSSNVGYYLSTNNTLDGSDVLLATSTGGYLAAKGSSYRDQNLTIPQTTSSGTYYLLFVADNQNGVAESDEQNNVVSLSFSVVPPSVDLSINSTSLSPTSVMAGNYVSINGYVSNQGNATVKSVTVGFYLSKDAVLDGSDKLLTNSNLGTIDASGYAYFYPSATIPSGTTPGSYYVLVVADYQNQVTETNEQNNLSALALTVEAPTIDLTMLQAGLGVNKTTAGSQISASSYIYNQGNSTASSSNAAYYLSTDSKLDGQDVLLASSTGGQLGAQQYDSRSTTLTIPSGTKAGTYYVLFVADYQNTVAESNEQNNVSAVSLAVEDPYVDLQAYSVTTSSYSVVTGGKLDLYGYIYNQGNMTSAATSVGFYLSKNATYDGTDVLLSNNTLASITGTNSYYNYGSVSSTVTIPTGTAVGTYYLLMVADNKNSITESNEQNNVTYTSISVVQPSVDLYISDASLSRYSVAAGSNFTTGFYVINQGNTSASTSNAQVYLSSNTTFDGNDVLLVTSTGGALGGGSYSYRNTSATVPTTTTPGTYYVLFVADATNQVSETNEQNNTYGAIQITVTAPFKGVIVPASGTNTLTTCNADIYDNGGTENYASYSDGALVIKPGTTGAKVQLTFSQLSLEVYSNLYIYDGTSTNAPLLATYYYYQNSNNTVQATNSEGALTLVFSSGYYTSGGFQAKATCILPADLTVSGVSLQTSSTTPGSTLTASATITNSGQGNATYSNVGYYLSSDQTFSVSDVPLATVSGGTLNAGSSATRGGTLSVPAGTSYGTYYVLCVADPDKQEPESNENNNVAVTTLKVGDAEPNLTLASATLQAGSVLSGGTLTSSVVVKNDGSASAASSTLGYYLSANATWESSDVLLQTATGASLAASGTATRTATLTIPATTTAGSYYVLFVADPSAAVTESNETDNVASVALTVNSATVSKPDLAFVAASGSVSPASIVAGKSLTASATVTNLGTTSATSVPLTMYLSADNKLDAADVKLGAATDASLTNGLTRVQQITAAIPTTTKAGSYYVLLMLDAETTLSETSRANNLYSLPLTVSVGTAQREQTAGLTISVYPNPTHSAPISVHMDGVSTTKGAATLTLYNSLGQRVAQQVVRRPGSGAKAEFDTRTLAQGVYMLHITGEQLHVVRRVVVD
ncbi:hypothetical protein PK28_15460 [Hymenobacter sp. DG25B]|uniref:CARDB domain-containing protein n=1 Tax=Hymenobacter sp. DG25B TaxID=1385664 RepID=UPI000540AC02|nr:CARDB domain-containing protein [Hymenobacter sp. DG25B]AIZ64717.1 hypothetical protein PK28_15460 [Hymenobacter sp. DG25B]